MKHLILFFLIFLCIAAFAEITVEIDSGSNQLAMNETVDLKVIIKSTDGKVKADVPQFDETDDFSISKVMNLTQGENIRQYSDSTTGRFVSERVFTATYSYMLAPKKEGTFKLPGVSVKVDGKTYHAEGGGVKVTKQAHTDSEAFIQVEPEAVDCMLGDKVELTVTILAPVEARLFNWAYDTDRSGITNCEMSDDIDEEIVTRGRQRYRRLRFQVVLKPEKAGTFTLPPPTIACALPDKRQWPNFFGEYPTRQIMLQGNEVTVVVADLPKEGRPADFTGAIGRNAKIVARAEPLDVSVGDPILLTIEVTGVDTNGQLCLQSLKENNAFTDNFRVAAEESGISTSTGVVFQRTIRALSEKVTEIPSVRVTYFDREQKAYKTVESKPIPLNVAATRNITMNDVQMHSLPGDDSDGKNLVGQQLTSRNDGLNDMFDVSELLQPQGRIRPERILDSPPKICAAFLAFPGLWLILLAIGQIRRSSPEAVRTRRRRHAASDFQHGLSKIRVENDGAVRQLDVLLQEFLAARFGLQPGTITFSDVKPCLLDANVPTEIHDDVRTLMEACVAAKFGGEASPNAADDLLKKARAISKVLA